MENILTLINLVISNISTVDIEIIEEIAECVPKSQVAYLSPIFDFITNYYKNQKELPSVDYLKQSFPGVWQFIDAPLPKESLNILLYELKKDSAIINTLTALQNRDIESAQAALQNSLTKAEFTETKAEDICSLYDEMSSLPEGIQIGVPELDRVYKNFSYGTNNFIAAPQKSGKTTAAISITYDGIMSRGMKAIYFTLEVKPSDIYANMFARHAHEMGTKLNAQSIKKNLLSKEERDVLELVQNDFIASLEKSGGKLAVIANHDFPEFTRAYMKQYLEQKKEEWGRVDLVIIDHIGLTGYYNLKGVPDKKDRINAWIKFTTDLCKGFNDGKGFILISLMQINRQGALLMKKGREIGFDVLAEANEAEKSAHTITVMYSTPEWLLSNQVKMYSLANRNGPPLTTDAEDNSVMTRMDPSIYVLGHRKYNSDASSFNPINLGNRELLKEVEETTTTADSLFSEMLG